MNGSVGDSYDNALAENLWILIKTECSRGSVFADRVEANLALFEYIDGFYGGRRIQARIGRLSPIESEEKCYTAQASAEQANLKPRQPALTSADQHLPHNGGTSVPIRGRGGPGAPAAVNMRGGRPATQGLIRLGVPAAGSRPVPGMVPGGQFASGWVSAGGAAGVAGSGVSVAV
ncbi:IS3 family transposase [Streptomyces sp. NPDC048275]|uniref:IS3 family transposase n=1 Tax=Streptomyces sp. NPDC048275 TaxID=3155629 RepID=UPI00340ED010